MLIGVPKEVKTHEFRVGLTATSAKELVQSGHTVVGTSRGRRWYRPG
jgi:alanine dehydrogenase